MAHLHSVYDSDTHFSINPTTRIIQNAASKKYGIVQFDHNSERFTFDLPRYVEGHDMSLCNKVEVHYINIGANGEKNEGVYVVDDIQISHADENVVICSWLISANATKLAGTLSFLIRFACLTNDVIDYAWHTNTYTGFTISEGMNNGEAVMDVPVDVLEGWKNEVLAEVEAAVERVEKVAEEMNSIVIDDELSETSENPVQNKVIAKALSEISVDAPSFDLVALGLPTVPMDGSTVLVKTDTTEIMAALDKGAVKFAVNVLYNGQTLPIEVLMNNLGAGGQCICGYTFALNNTKLMLTLVFVEGAIQAYVSTMESEKELPEVTAIDLSGFDTNGTIVETYADGTSKTTTIEFDDNGNPTKITDGNGEVTTLIW